MMPARYTAVLQERLHVADLQWRYSLPSRPKPEETTEQDWSNRAILPPTVPSKN